MHELPLESGEGGERREQTCDLHVTWGCEKTQLSRISEKLKLAVFPSQIHHHLTARLWEDCIPRLLNPEKSVTLSSLQRKCSILLNPWSNGQDNPLEAIGAWRLPRESNDLKELNEASLWAARLLDKSRLGTGNPVTCTQVLADSASETTS